MRVLFTVSNWRPHYFPMVALAWALRGAGHEVRVLCAGSETENLARCGLTPVPLFVAPDLPLTARLVHYLAAKRGAWRHTGLPLHPVTGAELGCLEDFDLETFTREHEPVVTQGIAAGIEDALAFTRGWQPDLVIRDPMSWEGVLLSMVTGTPVVLHLWGPFGPIDHQRHAHFLQFLPHRYRTVFARYGIDENTARSPETVLDPSPPSLAPPVAGSRLRVRHIPYHGPGELPAWSPPTTRRPRVLVTWSTATTRILGARTFVVPAILEALSGEDIEQVVLVCPEDFPLVGPLPPNAVVPDRYVPLDLVLPGCSAAVHHGGAGASMASLVHGVPQLSIPVDFDQLPISELLAASGTALSVGYRHASVGHLTASVKRLLYEPSFQESADRLRAECAAMPPPGVVLATLEQLAAGALPAP